MTDVAQGLGEDTLTDINFLLARANAVAGAASARALAPLGLRVRSYAVLALAAGGSRPSQRSIASYLRLDPSQVVSLVDGLQDQGLVLREPDPGDRRTKVVVATRRGREVHRRAVEVIRGAEDEVHADLAPDERAQLSSLLHRVAFPAGE